MDTKKIVSYLPERTYLTSSRTVIDLVEYFEDFYDNFNREKAMSMLESLQINLNSRLKTLSKGTKEKGSAGAGYEQGSRSLHPG